MDEIKVLKSTLRKIESDKGSIVTRSGFSLLLWLIVAATILAMYGFREDGAINTLVAIAVSMIVGCFVGVVASVQTAEKQWPFIKKHIDKISLESRINDLST